MSAAAIALQFIFEFVGFLLSLQGLATVLAGFVLFLALPVVPKATGEFHKLCRLHLWLAAGLLKRAAIVVSEHGDLLLKRMSFSDLGVEQIAFDDGTKDFGDPAARLHHWMGIPFALANEEHGVLFDPRDAALGQRKADAEETDAYSVHATNDEWESHEVGKWVRGAFEYSSAYELVKLEAVKHLVDGGERAEYPARIEEFYKHSRDPFKDGASTVKVFAILAAILGPFAGCWVIASQGGGGGSTGGSTVSYNLLVLLGALTNARGALGRIDWKFIGKALAVALPLPVVFAVLFFFVSPFLAIFAYLALGIGFWLLPLLAMLFRVSTTAADAFASIFIKLGLLGYDRPVLEWTASSYRLREYDKLDDTTEVENWYGLGGSLIGFTFTPEPESWGSAGMSADDVAELQAGSATATDGGTPETNIPDGFVPAPSIRRTARKAAFVPEAVTDACYYVHSGIATGWWTDSANGKKSLQRLLEAKDKYGGDNSRLEGRTLIYTVGACGMLSFGMGVFVFFL